MRKLVLSSISALAVTLVLAITPTVAHAASVPFDPILSSASIEGYVHNPQLTAGYAVDVCFGRLRDGTQAARNHIDSVFEWATDGTLYTCREMYNSRCNGTQVDPNTNPYFYSANCWSNHAQGRAIDVMVGGNAPSPVPLDRGNRLVTWLLESDANGNSHARARRLGIQQILWNDRCWSSQSTGDRNVMTAPAMRICNSDHFNHVHLDFTTAGADGLTSAYTGAGGPVLTGTSGPVLYNPHNRNIQVYFNSGGVLTERFWSAASGWSGGTLDAPITGSPFAIHNPNNGNIEVYFNSGGTLKERYWSPTSGWSAIGDLDAPITGSPFAIHNPNNGNIQVYFNSGGVLTEKFWSATSGWSGGTLDAPITGSPFAIHNPNNGSIEVYFNSGGTLKERYWSPTSGWSAIGDLDAPITGSPFAIHNPNNGSIEVYFNSGGTLKERYWSPTSGWSAIGSLQVPITE